MKTVLVKIGGKAAEDEGALRSLCAEMASRRSAESFLIVHGGGAEVTALSKRLGIQSVFVNGVRQTTPEEMDVVEMVLSGKVNKKLVRLCNSLGLKAVGISGCDAGLCVGEPEEASRTGTVRSVNRAIVDTLLHAGYLPVISPVSADWDGLALNINADSVAFGLAAELAATALVFFSDIPGVLRDGAVIKELVASDAPALIQSGVISGGMIPKVSASLEAVGRGVGNVIIGQYRDEGSLAALLDGTSGTRIHA